MVFTLTYAGTLGVALLMFLGQFAAFTALLTIAAIAELLIRAARAARRRQIFPARSTDL
ncbi:hypothetical protein [Arthrobacter sp. KBS0703]|uniref:hypothetical protein n=1 Tax=Arthrobacter sp. KBS0703 TaxID=1955698 RepID=UPI00163DC4ED|nr:hypothetical protein [Arthrobacter sp. KBS0703]